MSEKMDVLLVGEGNFSFSAALCESDDVVRLTATCLQTEQQITAQENAAQNIQRLRDRGCTVLFEVDCTLLSEHEVIRHRLYDRVIFNFPHCGRKSGVKKNRTLLVKFFTSCAEVLKADAEVHVALCNGQGGTPHDNPVREWHNSWQVVAMAAEAGLVLSEIRPFDRHKHHGYRCTGYRSQDKGFHVDGALTHVFTRSRPYTRAETLKLSSLVGKEMVLYELPEELSEYVNRNFLGLHSHHPVKAVLDQLLREIKSSWPVCEVSGSFPELVICPSDRLRSSCSDLNASEIYWIKPTGSVPSVRRDGSQPAGEQPSSGGSYALRPSLLVHADEITRREDFSPGTFHALSGLVFRRVPVSPEGAPAFHQLLLVGVLPSASRPVEGLQSGLEALLSHYEVSFTREQLGEEQRVRLSSRRAEDFARITSVPVAGVSCLLTLLLNLDHLAALTHSIPDWRLLWSGDPRFLAQVRCPFRPFSLYPPSYTHDVSFWVEPDGFDELEFHQAVRVATCGAVRDVRLVDRFRHPHMGHASLCYRLVYQSPDRALSRRRVLELQEQLRTLLPQRLNVTLR